MLYIIGASGKAGSGKDTIVDYLTPKFEEHGFIVSRFSFAEGVKIFSKTYFGEICDPVVKDPVSRFVLQGIGQMLRSEVSSDFWVDRARRVITKEAEEYIGKNHVVFITDVRYLNEAESISEKDTFNLSSIPERNYLIRINGRTSLTGDSSQHESETSLDNYTNFNFIYNNNKTIEDLYSFADRVLEEVIHDNKNW